MNKVVVVVVVVDQYKKEGLHTSTQPSLVVIS